MSAWLSNPAAGGIEINQLSAGHPIAYFSFDVNDTVDLFSKVLDTSRAGRLDITFIQDTDRTTATPTGACRIYAAAPLAADLAAVLTSISGLPQISVDTDGDGIQNDLTLNGSLNRRGMRDVMLPGVVVQITTLPAGTERSLLIVQGHF